jgi:predicted phosphodiesterase
VTKIGTDQLKIERTGKDVLTVRIERKAGATWDFLLISDIHFDSVHCDRTLLRRLLDEAKQKGAGVLIGGDLFDAMVGVGDRRGGKSELREELIGTNYLDLLVDSAVSFFRPYAENLIMVGSGNHDTSIVKYHETDLVERFCRDLGVQHMGYSCFVDFMFSRVNGGRCSYDLYYHHGYGGGGQATKGAGQNARRAQSYDADIFWSGHIHEMTYQENVKVYLGRKGDKRESRQRREVHVVGGGFKREFAMAGGWAMEKGMPAKPVGGWWLRFTDNADSVDFSLQRT